MDTGDFTRLANVVSKTLGCKCFDSLCGKQGWLHVENLWFSGVEGLEEYAHPVCFWGDLNWIQLIMSVLCYSIFLWFIGTCRISCIGFNFFSTLVNDWLELTLGKWHGFFRQMKHKALTQSSSAVIWYCWNYEGTKLMKIVLLLIYYLALQQPSIESFGYLNLAKPQTTAIDWLIDGWMDGWIDWLINWCWWMHVENLWFGGVEDRGSGGCRCLVPSSLCQVRQHIQCLFAATHTHPFNCPFPGLPGWASTRKVKPIWILRKQETVSGSGISWATCKSAPRSRQITTPAPFHSVFYRPDALPDAQPTASKHWRFIRS